MRLGEIAPLLLEIFRTLKTESKLLFSSGEKIGFRTESDFSFA